MARQLSIGMSKAQAQATAQAISNAYNAIDQKGMEIEHTMLNVAPLLSTLRTSNGWKLLDNMDSDGNTDHKTFTKWAEEYFKRSHSVISETCKVGTRFFLNGELNDRYSNYGYTQLLRLSPLTDEEIENNGFSPEMSSNEIRKKVREITTAKKELTDSKKNDEKSKVNTSALASAMQHLGVDMPKDEPQEETPETVTFTMAELPEAVREWFESIHVSQVVINA